MRLRVDSVPEIVSFQAGESKPPSVQVMFSGGIDSTILAAILCDILHPSIDLDLVNVSFDASRSPDRISSLFAISDLRAQHPKRIINLIFCDYDMTSTL